MNEKLAEIDKIRVKIQKLQDEELKLYEQLCEEQDFEMGTRKEEWLWEYVFHCKVGETDEHVNFVIGEIFK
jgi:hypothetical protein